MQDMRQQSHPRQRLASLLLGRPVLDFIAEHRANGASFRTVAAELRDATSGEIDVSDVTVRAWVLASAQQEPEALNTA